MMRTGGSKYSNKIESNVINLPCCLSNIRVNKFKRKNTQFRPHSLKYKY